MKKIILISILAALCTCACKKSENELSGIWAMEDGYKVKEYLNIAANIKQQGIYCMNFSPEKRIAEIQFAFLKNKMYTIQVNKLGKNKYEFVYPNGRKRIAYIANYKTYTDVFYMYFTDSSGFIPGVTKDDHPSSDGFFRSGDYKTINECTNAHIEDERISVDFDQASPTGKFEVRPKKK